ncbi:TIGR04197 family type VII secretion effector [Streptococcus caballi]|uniref:TIGR04197 family type VII secretion effector n=1 Tax=Streptococcus caballi TaxID=439220 RepID=UPI00036A4279|nr:TIGR04197 family type VII secretion effector [Streptococcus caballi]
MIQSNLSLASSQATAISSAGANLLGGATASKDTVTTLKGNTNAHSAIDLDASTVQQVASAINSFVGLIHSTASEFESTDQRLAQALLVGSSNTTASQTLPNTFQPNPNLFGGK